ncbi:MAG: cytochrome c3 family protein, partial [Deltaproteobacteria bacterium]|nr:cytochrome c3 family protein [Deltaproteobacteria bacterium]
PGMIIPPEYPLLENGRMTCMTCHQPHSSNNEARLLKEGKKELCTGCHTNY